MLINGNFQDLPDFVFCRGPITFVMDELLRSCTESNKLHPSLRRHMHRMGDYVIKIPLDFDERDFYGDVHDPSLTQLNDENAVAATRLTIYVGTDFKSYSCRREIYRMGVCGWC